ncbi:MAG TPA: hypothetical protein VMZ91_09765 [Candidatus Paceibacterota bacterium]|nr:hypothetical protein [Candidatus Paceibacterota bacterium]
MNNTHEKGKKLELYVAEMLQEIFLETPPIRPTKASSGGSHNTETADINSQNVFVECKNHNKGWFEKKVWEKLITSIPFGSQKPPMYVVENFVGNRLIMLNFEDLCRLLKRRKDV